jgi:hypothetical protein
MKEQHKSHPDHHHKALKHHISALHKMAKQGHKDRLDEHLGAKHGKESHHKQSMKDRRHESIAMSHKHSHHDLEKAFHHMKKHGG